MKIILHKASAVKGLAKIAGVALDELDSLGGILIILMWKRQVIRKFY